MKLTFLGAAGMVTGSCYLLETGDLRLLIDCGLFHGREDELNREPFRFYPGTLDGVILTHAHIDHSGRLPLLRKQGFRGPIYTHPATADLARIMLLDSAYIQETEAERENRKARRAGRPLTEPLYSQSDARSVTGQFQPILYGVTTRLSPTLEVRLQDAGHILGSAIVEIFHTAPDGRRTKLVFSGDVGQPNRPILQNPSLLDEADYLVLESTYGGRRHDPPLSTREALASIIHSTIAKGGNVVIPAFAVGRTQELLYELNGLVEAGQVPRNLKVVLDSPLAIAATEITGGHSELFDEAARRMVERSDDPFAFPGLIFAHTPEESMALNQSKEPKVIISASGMCEAGRVVHHLKHNLWRSVSTVLFVGFQAEGTLGRRLLDGARRVRIHGDDVAVRARIESLQGLSAHADQAQLLDWVSQLQRPPARTLLVHGEATERRVLAQLLDARGHRVELPMIGEEVLLDLAPARSAAKLAERTPRKGPSRVALADGAALARTSKRMAAVLREFTAVRKSWHANGPHLPTGQAEELQQQAEEVLRSLEGMRRLIESADA